MREPIEMGKDPKAVKKALKYAEEENANGYLKYESILFAKSISYGLTPEAAYELIKDMRMELQETDIMCFKPLVPVKENFM
jgi:hypothetical protein